jgi:hypothetical protein
MDLLKSYPSGRVTASRRKKIASQPAMPHKRLSDAQEFTARMVQIHGADDVIAAIRATNSEKSLGLSSVANLSTDAPNDAKPLKLRRGSKGISSRSRQQVRDSATLLEERYGVSQLAFVTHTIPPKFVTEVHQNWAKILANLRRRYIRLLHKAGLPEELVMVSEYQESRLSQTGYAVLHVHIVFAGRRKRQHWEYNVETYKKHWKECCSEYCQHSSKNAEWQSATRVEGIRKSCSAYLSKYMSKGTSALRDILAINPDAFIPSSWHILTQPLRVRVRQSIRHFEGESASNLFDWLISQATTLLKFNRYIKVPTRGGYMTSVGWYGELRDKTLLRTLSVL